MWEFIFDIVIPFGLLIWFGFYFIEHIANEIMCNIARAEQNRINREKVEKIKAFRELSEEERKVKIKQDYNRYVVQHRK
jgi:hypothetical protein